MGYVKSIVLLELTPTETPQNPYSKSTSVVAMQGRVTECPPFVLTHAVCSPLRHLLKSIRERRSAQFWWAHLFQWNSSNMEAVCWQWRREVRPRAPVKYHFVLVGQALLNIPKYNQNVPLLTAAAIDDTRNANCCYVWKCQYVETAAPCPTLCGYIKHRPWRKTAVQCRLVSTSCTVTQTVKNSLLCDEQTMP